MVAFVLATKSQNRLLSHMPTLDKMLRSIDLAYARLATFVFKRNLQYGAFAMKSRHHILSSATRARNLQNRIFSHATLGIISRYRRKKARRP